MRIISALAVLTIALSLPSCATIISGTTQKVNVASNPSGASVQVGEISAATPTILELERGGNYAVQVAHPGYQPQAVTLSKTLNMIYLLNLIVWPGLIVDALTGAMWEINPATVAVTLQPTGPAPLPGAPIPGANPFVPAPPPGGATPPPAGAPSPAGAPPAAGAPPPPQQ